MTAWIEARFRSRPNRFVVRAARGRHVVDAFLPNPGRLEELLQPGVPLRLRPATGPHRSTRYDVLAAQADRQWVCLDTRLANAAVAEVLRQKAFAEFRQHRSFRSEPPWSHGRFDFLLEDPGRCWLEVKMVSLVVDRLALFPDAPTARGARHLRELAGLARSGDRAAVLFLVVRRASRFAPNASTDPAFANALREAADAGVEVLVRRASLRGDRLAIGARLPTTL